MPKTRNPEDYIVPLNINGLDGRMLHLPAKNKKTTSEILFVYGHHSSLERWWGVMLVLNRYAAVTMPDLPGFGGMDSFYTIGKKPSIDNLADYLAAFIKLRYKRKKIIIAGMSVGFVIATRMLQKYPELTKKVTLLVSLVGFAHQDDFLFSRTRYYGYLLGSKILTRRVPAVLFRHVFLNPTLLRAVYAKGENSKHKFALAEDQEEFDQLMQIEIGLWHNNDVRTWAYTTIEMLKLDNCKQRVDLPIWHVAAKNDHFFDNHLVEQHMRVIFKGFKLATIDLKAHAPSVIADEKMAEPLIPKKLQKVLASLK